MEKIISQPTGLFERISTFAIGLGVVAYLFWWSEGRSMPEDRLWVIVLSVTVLGVLFYGAKQMFEGVFAWNTTWKIQRGKITVLRENVIARRELSFTTSDIASLEIKWVSTFYLWGYHTLVLTTSRGKRFELDMPDRDEAERVREEVEYVLRGQEPEDYRHPVRGFTQRPIPSRLR